MAESKKSCIYSTSNPLRADPGLRIAVTSAFIEAYCQAYPGVMVDTLNVWEEKLPDFGAAASVFEVTKIALHSRTRQSVDTKLVIAIFSCAGDEFTITSSFSVSFLLSVRGCFLD